MSLLGRIIVIVLALFVASLAAGMAIAIGLLGPEWNALSADPGVRAGFWVATFAGTTFTGAVAFLPVVILIAIAEAFRIRSLLVYATAGALVLLAGYYTSGLAPPSYEESIDAPPPLLSRQAELAVAAGAVLGLVYWTLAGRNAGKWRG